MVTSTKSREKAQREKQNLKKWYVDLHQKLDADAEKITQQYIGDTNLPDDIAYVNAQAQEKAESDDALRQDMLQARTQRAYKKEHRIHRVECWQVERIPVNRYRTAEEEMLLLDEQIKNIAHATRYEKSIFETLLNPEEQQRFYQDIGKWLAAGAPDGE